MQRVVPISGGGDSDYLTDIERKLKQKGYSVRTAIADTPGVAWAVARYGKHPLVIAPNLHVEALLPLPPESLRLEQDVADRLHKLGLHQIRQFIHMPRPTLRRRFGPHFMMRLKMAMGEEIEAFEPVLPPEPYQERLPCM